MRAVIFIPTLTAGGSERVASILANTWCRYPETVVTIMLMSDDEIFFEVDPRVRLLSIGLRPNRNAITRLALIARALLTLRKLVKEERPDFVLSFMNKYNVFCLASLFKAGVVTIVSERDSPTEPNRRLNWVFRRIFYPLADGIITQTRASADYLTARIGNRNIAVIYNPILAPTGVAVPREKFVLNVGRLYPKKGQADLIRAFARIDRPDWRLVFCGDGPLRGDLQALASSLSIAERVDFIGQVRDVFDWYTRAGVFAFPSYFEGFPNVLAEAMVAGAPTVSYDCPTGPSELIRHGENGYLVEVGDVDKLASHIDALIADVGLAERFSREAARTIDVVERDAICAEYFRFCTLIQA